jgi:hypothetical protein
MPAYSYLTKPQLEGYLLTLMSWDELKIMRHSVAIASERDHFGESGDWIVAGGCTPRVCDKSGGIVAISMATGEPFLALKRWNKQNWDFFGKVPETLPAAVRQKMFEK